MKVDENAAGVSAKSMNDQLREGDIAIYTRDYGVRQGYFDIDPRSLSGDDLQVIITRIQQIAGETKMANMEKRLYRNRAALNVLAGAFRTRRKF